MSNGEVNDMKDLYKNKIIRSNSKAAEEIARELLCRIDELYTINKITRKSSYNMQHTGSLDNSKATTETEKRIAISMWNKEYEYIGKILDYEVPLKNSNKDEGVGKIDLIAYNKKTLTLLELKVPNSKETLLRCVLEIFTYWKQLDYQKLLHDFGLPQDTIIKKAVFVFENSSAHNEYKHNDTHTRRLMNALNVDMFLIGGESENYEVLLP